jgi:23S rRNA G2069 N7-methylase RlmK/C1962 C5-methylase RlmI
MSEGEADAKTTAQAEMLSNRLAKRAKHLRKWARRVGTDAFRLYDRDIPEIPLLLDIYGDSVSGALYERPYEKDDAEEDRWLEAMASAISGSLDIGPERIHLKRRKRQRGQDQYDRIAEVGATREVTEGGLRFRVNLSDYLDTGLFLDHRATRALVRAEAAGKRVLNLFCYTAAFSVHAAAGGALEVDSVDLSNTYLDWAAVNHGLNGFDTVRVEPEAFGPGGHPAQPIPGRFRLIRADALRFIAEAAKAGRTWDLIVLDPPTFSNSKKMEGTLDVRRDYADLIDGCLAITAKGGKLWFSTNARGFRLDAADFPGVAVTDVKAKTVDEDFRGRTLRSCYTFEV